uniref:Peptidase M12B domain-containing protein n=2 Tax=Caenorhabditis tropicalis TaxID=1561998 RepID=A0A1I7TW93_9PELO
MSPPSRPLNKKRRETKIEDDGETDISDWSEAKTDGKLRLITFLVGIDSAITRYYNYDEARIRSALVVLMHTVNQYFYPLNIRLSIIDILPVKGTNMGLDDFTAWRKEQRNLIEHDITVLLRHNYEGGIAYSNGICSKNSLMISGFFPEATMNNAWVFMHQLAHVIGLTHQKKSKCKCKLAQDGKCLKLRGFEECSVQDMVDRLSNHTCLSPQSPSYSTNVLVPKRGSLPVCGNGLQEEEEECDCGPERFCDNILCDAVKCRFVLQKAYLAHLIPMGFAVLAFLIVLVLWKFLFFPAFASLFRSFASLGKAEEEGQNREHNENLNDVDVEQAPVRMRPTTDVPIPAENRRTRFSDIYVTMRPISRFWEKFQKQKEGSAAPI